jgi:hypothetical protein
MGPATLREVAVPPVGSLAASESEKTGVWSGAGSVTHLPHDADLFSQKGQVSRLYSFEVGVWSKGWAPAPEARIVASPGPVVGLWWA